MYCLLIIILGLGVLQGIKLDQCITLDSSAGMFWKVCFFLLVFYFPVSNWRSENLGMSQEVRCWLRRGLLQLYLKNISWPCIVSNLFDCIDECQLTETTFASSFPLILLLSSFTQISTILILFPFYFIFCWIRTNTILFPFLLHILFN